MFRRRGLVALLLSGLLAVTLTACGDDKAAVPKNPLDRVAVSGDLGKAIKVDWKGTVSVDTIQKKTLVTGDGPKITKGQTVMARVWVGNGTAKTVAYDGYTNPSPEMLVAGALVPAFNDALVGSNPGSRVLVVSPPKDAFGPQGNQQLGLSGKDSVVIVVDIDQVVAHGPTGTKQPSPAWAPGLRIKDEKVTGFDFAGTPTPKPGDPLRTAVLIKGKGAEVTSGQNIVVNYLGQVFKAKAPFDDSYSRGEPASFPIGTGQVVKGWDQGLVGQTVGSRVVLAIPPRLGYGKDGNPQIKVSATDTMYFVVDILAAS